MKKLLEQHCQCINPPRHPIERISLLILSAMWVVMPYVTFAQPVALRPITDSNQAFEDAVHNSRMALLDLMAREHIPGLTVAVMVEGDLVWSEGFGFADLEQGVPVTSLTKMRIGSVSKPITSIALGLLYEQGKLDLDAPIQRYVPDFPRKKHEISTRQLAGHIAGIRHYRGTEFLSSRHYPTVDSGLKIFEADTLLFEPGEQYSYSSYGWNLISAVIEGASDEDFIDYMEASVFEPLGLYHTHAEYMDKLIYRRSRYYVKNAFGEILNAPYVDNSYKWAGGGFIATAEDVVRFGDGILNGDLLQDDTKAMMFESLKTSDGEETGYGLGWRVWDNETNGRLIGHTGGSVGGTTTFMMHPGENIILCIISNLSGTRYGDTDDSILNHFIRNKQKAKVAAGR